MALLAVRVVRARVAPAVKVVLEDQVVLLVLVDRAMTATVSRGRVTESQGIGLRVTVSVSRGHEMGSLATALHARVETVRSEMASVSRGHVTVSLAIALRETESVSRGHATVSPVTDQRVPRAMVSASPGHGTASPVTDQRVPREMVSASRGLVTVSPAIVRSATPDLRVRVATVPSVITTPIR